MKKHRKPRPVSAPMLVMLATSPDLELSERLSIEALTGGWATSEHYDNLADCRNLLELAAQRDDMPLLKAASAAGYAALTSVKARHDRTGRFGVTAEELANLKHMVTASREYWSRQTGTKYSDAVRNLIAENKRQAGAPAGQHK